MDDWAAFRTRWAWLKPPLRANGEVADARFVAAGTCPLVERCPILVAERRR